MTLVCCPKCLIQYCMLLISKGCPKMPDGTVGLCVEMCKDDSECGDQMCCSNGCGHMCMDPVNGMTTALSLSPLRTALV